MLEYPLVEFGRGFALPGMPHKCQDVRETLHTNADGAMAEIGAARFRGRVEVDVNDAVKVANNLADNFAESCEVEYFPLGVDI
jgi:hypothetical protein